MDKSRPLHPLSINKQPYWNRRFLSARDVRQIQISYTPRQDLIFGCIRQAHDTEPKIDKGPQYLIILIEFIEYLSAKIRQVTFRHRNICRRKQLQNIVRQRSLAERASIPDWTSNNCKWGHSYVYVCSVFILSSPHFFMQFFFPCKIQQICINNCTP